MTSSCVFPSRFLASSILKLKPKDVQEFGVSKQTLWNVCQKINKNVFQKISLKIKMTASCFQL
mgnify:CR=1 FL=1